MVSMDSEIASIRAVAEAGMKNEERDWLTATEGDKCMMMRKTWKWSLGIDERSSAVCTQIQIAQKTPIVRAERSCGLSTFLLISIR